MVQTRTKYIGGGLTTTIIGLILFFAQSINFNLEIDGDLICAGTFEEPCEAHFNVTSLITYYIYNSNSVDLNFVPNVKDSYICKKDGRYRSAKRLDREQYPCGVGYREFDFKSPLTSRYKYVEKFVKGKKHEYKLVVFKYHTNDEIKWGGKITGTDFDPKFLPSYDTVTVCDTKTTKNPVEIFKSVTKQRSIVRDIVHYVNESVCSDEPINSSCSGIVAYNYSAKTDIGTENYNVDESQGFIIDLINESVNCRETELTTDAYRLSCPEDHRCDVIGNDFCILDCNDGDCNFDASENKGRGWSSVCIPIKDIQEVQNIRISSYKENYAKIEKI